MTRRDLYQIVNKVIASALLASMFASLASQSAFAKGENISTSAPQAEQCPVTKSQSSNEKQQTFVRSQKRVQWELTAELPAAASNAAIDALPLLRAGKVNATFANDKLTLANQNSNISQMRTALFDTAPEWMNFLGEPVDLIIYMHSDGSPITLRMEARNSTGYIWEVVPEDGSLYSQVVETNEADAAASKPQVTARYEGYGSTSLQNIYLSANGAGDTSVHMVYHRPFEPDASIRTQLKIWMPVAADIELSDPTPDVPNAAVRSSSASQSPSALDELLPKELPSLWDWRAQGIIPPIRNQGGCGSCWAFATTGVMEAAVAKSGGGLTDLSEQYLVSCNTEGWSCKGGWDSHEYNYDVLGKNQNEAGAVFESDMPYTATSSSCDAPLDHPYKLDGWGFVGDLNGQNYTTTIPTYDQLKNAIYTYGPITAGVCVGDAFGHYKNGLFATDEKSTCYYGVEGQGFYSPNHLIILVGWDDADQSLILRNSWDTWWGESGYMRIKYGTSLVGISPTWVTRADSTPLPELYQPDGTAYSTSPTYTWARGEVSSYKIQVYDVSAASYVINDTVSSSFCNTSTNRCSYKPNIVLVNNTNYKWRVASGSGAWNDYKTFTVKPSINFNVYFKNNKSGWSSVYGGWSLVNSTSYRTSGKQGYFSSVKHVNNYANVTYEVMMKRTGCSSCSNGLFVRGNSSHVTKEKGWLSSYRFFYSNNGYFSVQKASDNGSITMLSNRWNKHSAIKRDNWNKLKVVAVDSSLKFYINGTLVWSGDDSDLTAGQLGIGMYRDYSSTGNDLSVEWAKAVVITTMAGSTNNTDVVVPGIPTSGGNQRQSP